MLLVLSLGPQHQIPTLNFEQIMFVITRNLLTNEISIFDENESRILNLG